MYTKAAVWATSATPWPMWDVDGSSMVPLPNMVAVSRDRMDNPNRSQNIGSTAGTVQPVFININVNINAFINAIIIAIINAIINAPVPFFYPNGKPSLRSLETIPQTLPVRAFKRWGPLGFDPSQYLHRKFHCFHRSIYSCNCRSGTQATEAQAHQEDGFSSPCIHKRWGPL
jgi:hypothetical protein